MYCNVITRQSTIIEGINNVWHNPKHKQGFAYNQDMPMLCPYCFHDKFRFSYMYDNQKPGFSVWSTYIWNFVIIVVMNWIPLITHLINSVVFSHLSQFMDDIAANCINAWTQYLSRFQVC